MAMQTASRTGPQGSGSMPYPPLPASPTLTNPDMILPDYDRPSSPGLSQLPLDGDMWNGGGPHASADAHFSQAFVAGPVTTTTPIIYGNGTMLSDIGEVTEVESTVGGRPASPPSPHSSPRPARQIHSSDDGAMRSSPTMGYHHVGVKEKSRRAAAKERRSSMESTSTITTQERGNLFADFDDDSASVEEDVNFHGDDEESVASSYFQDDDHPAPERTLRNKQSTGTLQSEDRYSTTSLSKRAEQILANAKQRLSVSRKAIFPSSFFLLNPLSAPPVLTSIY
jgi:hypothetical protein